MDQQLIKASTAYLRLSQRIEVSRTTVYRWIDEGKFGNPVRVDGALYVLRDKVDEYIDMIFGGGEKKPSHASHASQVS